MIYNVSDICDVVRKGLIYFEVFVFWVIMMFKIIISRVVLFVENIVRIDDENGLVLIRKNIKGNLFSVVLVIIIFFII